MEDSEAGTRRAREPLAVHLAVELEPEQLSRLGARLGARVRLATGEPAAPASFEVLVAGVPEAAWLDASPALRTLVIPWAGLPGRTRERLRERPHLAACSIHHNAPAAAEMALALLLAAATRLVPIDAELRRGDWSARHTPVLSLGLAGRRTLVLGYGAIGRRVARACAALEMKVTAVRRAGPARASDGGVEVRAGGDLAALARGAAALVVTLPLTDQTRGIVDRAVLEALAPDAIVVNVGRGPIIDEQALFEVLEAQRIGGAGIDVWYRYPEREADVRSTPPSELPFHTLPQVVMSPHRASAVAGDEPLRTDALATTLEALASGETPPHPVDVEAGY